MPRIHCCSIKCHISISLREVFLFHQFVWIKYLNLYGSFAPLWADWSHRGIAFLILHTICGWQNLCGSPQICFLTWHSSFHFIFFPVPSQWNLSHYWRSSLLFYFFGCDLPFRNERLKQLDHFSNGKRNVVSFWMRQTSNSSPMQKQTHIKLVNFSPWYPEPIIARWNLLFC